MDAGGNYVSGSILQYCVVEYAGYGAYSTIDAHSLLIDHCTVRNNDGRGIYSVGTASAPARITNNIVTNNTVTIGFGEANGGGIYAKDSTVSGNTVSSNSAIATGGGVNRRGLGGGIYAYNSTVSGNTVSGNSTAASSNGSAGGIYASGSTVSGNIVSGNSATFYGGGIYASGSTVSGNTVSGNSAASSGGGIYANNSTVSGNTVTGNTGQWCNGGGIGASGGMLSGNTISGNSAGRGGGIWIRGNTTVLSNTVSANSVSMQGAGVHVRDGSFDFLYNTVVGNSGPAGSTVGGLEIVYNSTPQVHYNNFYGNEPYDVTVVSSDDISGTNNYWGTVSSVDILAQVYDWYDDSSLDKFLYVPYLQDPSPDAPFPPPIGLTADFQDSSVILSWDAHPSFTTGWGYKIYYDTDSSLPPYEGTGLNEGDSPIDVGDDTSYTLTGLDPSQDYYFAVTAYDNEGHESWYSNLVQKQGGYWVYLPVVLRQ